MNEIARASHEAAHQAALEASRGGAVDRLPIYKETYKEVFGLVHATLAEKCK